MTGVQTLIAAISFGTPPHWRWRRYSLHGRSDAPKHALTRDRTKVKANRPHARITNRTGVLLLAGRGRARRGVPRWLADSAGRLSPLRRLQRLCT